MADKEKFYITTAISYPNGVPHIGHGYEAITTDAIARFERLDGKDVFFLTGTDEHGLKMKQTAAQQVPPVTPAELADRNSARFREMVKVLDLSNDDFIRTTERRHYEACTALWKRMAANGDIFVKPYAGWYSVRDEAFYAESETTVREDGVRIGPQGSPVEWTEEETYFFRLSAYQDKLLAHYEANPDIIL
ncbi:MAG: class I tRNA ligase family protein, partial [Hyphomicrobiaceae bacterium]